MLFTCSSVKRQLHHKVTLSCGCRIGGIEIMAMKQLLTGLTVAVAGRPTDTGEQARLGYHHSDTSLSQPSFQLIFSPNV